ncbi:hypothetical protein [Lentzea sp. NBRC 102530]|uniref:hypothetical protein n=1 Tax=Lentzea sp. NBRC 102530 TaxID=3032201 RepID=UPI0024A59A3A|nr:hypothetical protein [Lentzea sp. NBRC 102530]GLY54036.1 hypothetical protein Lesp01_76920 [Lentzea sp. NBRC 102530]
MTDADRWQFYEALLDSLDLLHAALAREPDAVLRTSVVLRVLELVEDHTRWLDLVPGDEYELRRSREVGLLRRTASLDVGALPEWSDWLQLRLAEAGTREVLTALAAGGRTRRSRRTAAAALRGR